MRLARIGALRGLVLLASVAIVASGESASAQCQTQLRSGGTRAGVGGDGADVASILWDPDGAGPAAAVLAVGGSFAVAGEASAANVATYDFATATWSALGQGVNGTVRALAVLPTGELVVGGSFTTAGGASANRVAAWNGTSWTALGAGLDGDVAALAVLQNGRLVACGSFSSSGGLPMPGVAQWDGVAWSPLGPSASAPHRAQSLFVRANGDLVVGCVNFSGSSGSALVFR